MAMWLQHDLAVEDLRAMIEEAADFIEIELPEFVRSMDTPYVRNLDLAEILESIASYIEARDSQLSFARPHLFKSEPKKS